MTLRRLLGIYFFQYKRLRLMAWALSEPIECPNGDITFTFCSKNDLAESRTLTITPLWTNPSTYSSDSHKRLLSFSCRPTPEEHG